MGNYTGKTGEMGGGGGQKPPRGKRGNTWGKHVFKHSDFYRGKLYVAWPHLLQASNEGIGAKPPEQHPSTHAMDFIEQAVGTPLLASPSSVLS